MMQRTCTKVYSLKKLSYRERLQLKQIQYALFSRFKKKPLKWSCSRHLEYNQHYRRYIHYLRYANYVYYYK